MLHAVAITLLQDRLAAAGAAVRPAGTDERDVRVVDLAGVVGLLVAVLLSLLLLTLLLLG